MSSTFSSHYSSCSWMIKTSAHEWLETHLNCHRGLCFDKPLSCKQLSNGLFMAFDCNKIHSKALKMYLLNKCPATRASVPLLQKKVQLAFVKQDITNVSAVKMCWINKMQPKWNLSVFIYSTMCRSAKKALNWKHVRWMLLELEVQILAHTYW